jgi:hypothetical protein
MAKKKSQRWKKSQKMAAFEKRPLSQRIARGSVPFLLILLTLYAAVLLLSRTEGCRTLLAEQLSERTGVELRIEGLRVGWKFDVEARNVHTVPAPEPGQPGFAAASVRLNGPWYRGLFSGRPRLESITADDIDISLVLSETGTWEPAALAPLAEWLQKWGRFNLPAARHPEEKKPSTSKGKKEGTEDNSDKEDQPSVLEEIPILLTGGEITWWDAHGHLLGAADGLTVESSPLSVPDRDLHHYRLRIESGATAQGDDVENLLVELLSTRGHHIVLALRADWKSAQSFGLSGMRSREEETTSRKAPTQPVRKAAVRKEDPDVVKRDTEELVDYFHDMLKEAVGSD